MSERWHGGAGEREVVEVSSEVVLGDKSTEAIKDIFSDQLERFVRLRKTHEDELNPVGVRMLDNDIVTRINDLRRLGHRDRATQIIDLSKRTSKT